MHRSPDSRNDWLGGGITHTPKLSTNPWRDEAPGSSRGVGPALQPFLPNVLPMRSFITFFIKLCWFQHNKFGLCPQYILIATYDQSTVPLLRFFGTLSSLLSNLKHQIRSRKRTDLRWSMRPRPLLQSTSQHSIYNGPSFLDTSELPCETINCV
jgi:hypothetical protein